MTRNDALEALDSYKWHRTHGTVNEEVFDGLERKIRQALTAQPSPDVECVQKMHELELPEVKAIKRECEQYIKDLFNPTDIHEQDRILGAMAAIDYLASKGHLKTTGEDEWQPFSKELLDKALSEPGQWEIRIAADSKEKA